MQKVPSRVEVLSWNENEVADLLREHKLHDCVDCIYQRHIDGQKLLNLKQGDVMFFLEIHDQTSRGKFWNIVQRITDKKGGVHNLMRNFQGNSDWNSNDKVVADEDDDHTNEFDDDSGEDSFDSDYDEPEPDPPARPQNPAISLERKETIKKNLLDLISKPLVNTNRDHDDIPHSEYPPSEDIYDMPEDGCGEPDDELYDVPSDESGGGVVTRRPPLERKESDQYLIPDNAKLLELQDDIDEDYEDLGGAPPPMGRHDNFETQEEYVVPDTKPNTIVPPRPPKPSADTNHKPPRPTPTEHRPPPMGHKTPPVVKREPGTTNNTIQKLQAKLLQEQVNSKAPEPPRNLKKPNPPTSKPPSNKTPPTPERSKPYPPKPDLQKSPAQPPRIPKKIPDIPVEAEPEVEDEYEFPEYPPPSKGKKPPMKSPPVMPNKMPPAVKPPPAKKQNIKKPPPPTEPEQDTYDPPAQPLRLPKPKPAMNHKPPPPVEIDQENYEAPETPVRPTKKVPAEVPETAQENYEPPEPPSRIRNKLPIPNTPAEPEENYEAPDVPVAMSQTQAEEPEEDYEVPDTLDVQKEAPPVPQESPNRKSHLKNFFNRSPSKKALTPNVPPKVDKKKSKDVPVTPEQPPCRQPPRPAGKNIFSKLKGENRASMALPSLPTDKSDMHSLPPKPPGKPAPKDKASPALHQRRMPDLPPTKPPHKTKEQLLQDQPWFHGSVSKQAVSDMLKSAKKDGAYLVRNSSRDPGKFIMSIFYKNDIRHLNIPCENGQYRLGDSGAEKFKSIEELVSHFNSHDVEFSAGGKTPLTHACMKQR